MSIRPKRDCYGIYMNFTELFIHFNYCIKWKIISNIFVPSVKHWYFVTKIVLTNFYWFLEFLIIHIDCSTTPCTIDPEKKYMVLQYSIKKHVMSRNMKHYYVFMLRLMTCEYHNGMMFFLNLQFQMYSHVFTNYFFNFHFKFLLLHVYSKHFHTLT